MPRFKLNDLEGQRFGRLTVIERVGISSCGHATWKCICDCGNDVIRASVNLTRKPNHKGCGCWKLQRSIQQGTAHPLYHTWRAIKQRCLDPDYPAFKNYGARGIGIWPEWEHDAPKFIAWIESELGSRPAKAQLDRINNDGNYEPGNLRWSTIAENMANRRQVGAVQNFSSEELLSELKRRGVVGWSSYV